MAETVVDHLVVLATTLAQGVQWCEATLGVSPGPGGSHPLFGTHNRLLRISSAQHRQAYLEIIALDPDASSEGRHSGKRWFDLDDEAVRAQLREHGPRLAHFVAASTHLLQHLTELKKLGLDRGESLAAQRQTPTGLLRWRISVRKDGQRLMGGTLPTLIQWEGEHPTATMAASGLQLMSLQAQHPQAALLRQAYAVLGLGSVAVQEGPVKLLANLAGPRGTVQLKSAGW